MRSERALDAVLGIARPLLAVGLAMLGLLAMLAGLTRNGEAPLALFLFGLGNLTLALPFAAATWLVRSHEPRLSRWRWAAGIGILLYCLGFVWPYIDRVWGRVQLHGWGNLSHYAWEHAGMLVNGGAGAQEFGAPFSVCIFLFLLRTALAHIQPNQVNEA